MQTNKKLITIFVIIIALIILIGLIFFMFLAPVPAPEPAGQGELPAVREVPVIEEQAVLPPPRSAPVVALAENDLKRLASSFVERWGTYSNQAGYSNVKDLELFMTKSMQSWSRNYAADAVANSGDTSIYYGIKTKSVVVETKIYSEELGRAEFLIKAQREESFGAGANARKFQQNANLAMAKEGGVWKIDRVTWED